MIKLHEYLHIKVPISLDGKWAIVREYGTHGAIDVITKTDGGYVFYNSKKEAVKALVECLEKYYPGLTEENFDTFPRPFDTTNVMCVSKDYPYMQIPLLIADNLIHEKTNH